ncbi:MAG: protein-L-isoaspartate(D-aspartate) O-methyltransferase [Chloroflexi bacterium]|nr:protein-L-isoaspartate(D-aspartate) O-methyltransferase [Chloroflexota bacterium]
MEEIEALRKRMQRAIAERNLRDARVLAAMGRVPRHLFVPHAAVEEAYSDHPLPIGCGQTISQPYMVAAMTSLLQLGAGSRVLEVGTGSGYQAAVLAELAGEVYSVEYVEALHAEAAARLAELGYRNVHLRVGDGYYGWPEEAPYDGILLTCAPERVPPPLMEQLADGGRLVAPIGTQKDYQVLWLLRREGARITSRRLFEVAFVPLMGHHPPPEA